MAPGGEGRERSWCSSDFSLTIHLTGASHYKIYVPNQHHCPQATTLTH